MFLIKKQTGILLLLPVLLLFLISGCATVITAVSVPEAPAAERKPPPVPQPVPPETAAEPIPAPPEPEQVGKVCFLPVPRSLLYTGKWCRFPDPELTAGSTDLPPIISGFIREALHAVTPDYSARREHIPENTEFPGTSVRIDPASITRPQGYRLEITPDAVLITAHDRAGAFYAVMTLKQLARQYRRTTVLPCLEIEDWPDFPQRGVMIDVSRDKVPKLQTLFEIVDLLSELKFNQLQLYTEHTFMYKGHEDVWKGSSPLTPYDIKSLDAYCRDRYIDLVPNQNSFGHMGRWLIHEQYASLAEIPGGSELCPTDPATIDFLKGLFSDLLPNFSSGMVNVGCDETYTIGKGRSKAAVEEKGRGRVYLDFLDKIHNIVKSYGKIMQFWGDIIVQYPSLIPEIPDGVIALEWGYEKNHPFASRGKRFAGSGIPFYVAPGTSTWNSLLGRTDNALGNLENAAENGLKNGAVGFLVADWGDNGHWQFLPVSFLPFGYAGAVSWYFEGNKGINIRKAVNVHVFRDAADRMGSIVFDLGNAHKKSGDIIANRTVYYRYLLDFPDGSPTRKDLSGVTAEKLQRTIDELERLRKELSLTDLQRRDGKMIINEYDCNIEMAEFACRLGKARIEAGGVGTAALPKKRKEQLAGELSGIIGRFRTLWLERNRPGGLDESTGRLERLLEMLSD